ncbi:hypothetical protein E2C01_006129 [Portunus trituberculatus]|uniref:Uncharacterized protein n=1 Tax=Portunus trituberculatus TaxID=210409 RepID=A0A5B7CYF8_PORTR|nr:hypothetical protein [Portunus trituberculatus]
MPISVNKQRLTTKSLDIQVSSEVKYGKAADVIAKRQSITVIKLTVLQEVLVNVGCKFSPKSVQRREREPNSGRYSAGGSHGCGRSRGWTEKASIVTRMSVGY